MYTIIGIHIYKHPLYLALASLGLPALETKDVSPLMGAFITAYVAFSVLAMMNVITGQGILYLEYHTLNYNSNNGNEDNDINSYIHM